MRAMSLSPSQVIVLATPVFLLLIAVEIAWGLARGRNTYRLSDAINSISLGMFEPVERGAHPAVADRDLHRRVQRRGAVAQRRVLDHLVRLAAGAGVLRPLLLLAAPGRPRKRHLLGRARGPSPEPGLQPVDGAAPDQLGRPARLDLLPANGAGRRPAPGVRRGGAGRPAVPVLGPHRARARGSAGSTAGSARRRTIACTTPSTTATWTATTAAS